jgi:hypothetical protein
MSKAISELFKEVASMASDLDEPVLALLCRMAALEAAHMDLSLKWNWNTTEREPETAIPDGLANPASTTLSEAIAKPYQVWTRSGTGIYSVIVPNAKAALATAVQLSSKHENISIKDMDGNEVELEVLRAMVDLEGSRAFQPVPR